MPDSRFAPGSTVLAVDAGSTSVRAALFDLAGECLHFWQQPCGHRADLSFVEQDPAAVLAATRLCLDNIPTAGGIQAAAIVSQGASALCFRRSDGEPLTPVLSWQDRRGEPYLGELTIGPAEVHRLTGLPLSCHYGATKLRWCLENLPRVSAAAVGDDLTAGPLMAYLIFHLCREHLHVVDSGTASRTQLWNLAAQQWEERLCREFQVPARFLPTCQPTNSLFGALSLGGHHVPVVFANRDQQAALFADGPPELGTAYVNLGTGAFVQALIPKPVGPEVLLVNRVVAGDGNLPLYSLEGTVHGAAGALPWLEHHLGFAIVPELLVDALESAPSEGKEMYFYNGVMGLGSPFWRSETRGMFSEGLTAKEKLLAWMESVVFMLAENLLLIQRQVPLERLSLSGGFSNLSGLAQRLADLTGLTCYRRTDAEATLRGAAFVAAGQPQSWCRAATETFVPAFDEPLRQRYRHWRAALDRLSV